MPNHSPHRFCTAPLLDWSDRHCRYMWRLLSKRAMLYSEMVTTGAILHGDRKRYLQFDAAEHPVALQIGGSDPRELAECARIAEDWGYDEINLNCGCPSDRVQSGRFGACLMADPELVAEGLAAMRAAVSIPVTVKHRIGIDDMEDYPGLTRFVEHQAVAGVSTFIVHARKAWLKGLSPKENREIPPLNYDMVYQLKRDYPQLEIVINGGIDSIGACRRHLRHVDGVMLGRAAYQTPALLAQVDSELFSGEPGPGAARVVEQMLPYIERQLALGARLNHITRHMLGLFQGLPGARRFRRHLSENAHRDGAGPEVVEQALAQVTQAA
ncbi:tRNA dihydrouridine(20/20a) synthase DusA [Microbulbifer thermotolerans]|uniref:tRNA dihydrouridine(20/20a) synthase DusA n=1 Tax=Microbulbifer thermotolerans TaxID=252514 RepID=UPI0022488B24|nr:tRNA dihydrouridine(20/20a) synthase DusA [Microbulbifer thermotolerans]MCX2783515.1 tRNA dihydrouridine(20/20a) synthase DusA [Microbulbifer thermotolerans]MCX2796287.1 tRNA dihydrouridine(20/20a) synthase DusA [Microbulbifer thermotolerans]MCX2835567.1 tRNA dihydrouridine(20/20a) synthase DusA [Microbulbifer thermotolerans]